MKPDLSIIICTHNPRREYLNKVLEALKTQSLPMDYWELIMVDNASTQSLALEIDLSWHPTSRCIREEKLGLTQARLCGIQEASSEIIIFVDDDNVLESDYLEIAFQIGKDWPMLGAWGGQSIAQFEETPPAWTQPYWESLGIRELSQDKWSNLMVWDTTPIGAGMCVRKVVAEKYSDFVHNDPRRLSLDRKGNLLMSCGDIDLAYTSNDLGLGTGLFTSLKLVHLMPTSRLQEEYLLRIVEGTTYSLLKLDNIRSRFSSQLSFREKLRVLMPWLINPNWWFVSPRERKFCLANTRGRAAAMREIWKSN